MLKIIAGIGTLTAAIAIGVVMLSPSGEAPATENKADGEINIEAAHNAESQYNSQLVWPLFEESCRGDEFMDHECSCMMDQVSAAHGIDATAYLALMGWDRFEEAEAIAERLGEDGIDAAVNFYHSKADGACARDQQSSSSDNVGAASSSTLADDAVMAGSDASDQSNEGRTVGDTLPTDQKEGSPAEGAVNTPPECILDNAIDAPGNLGIPLALIKDGEASPLQVLSGGERQRVAVARALNPLPNIIVLDEPYTKMSLAEISTLESCVIYTGGRARFGVGPQRGFTGKISTPGSDIAVTAGMEYVVWSEEDRSTRRFPAKQSFNLPASTASQIVFMNFSEAPELNFEQALVSMEQSNEELTIEIEVPNMAMIFIIAHWRYQNLIWEQYFGRWLQLSIPVNEVVLVPLGPLELSVGDASEPASGVKVCFASQQALFKALEKHGYDATTSLAIIGQVIRSAGEVGGDACDALELIAVNLEQNEETWRLDVSASQGPGVLVIDVAD